MSLPWFQERARPDIKSLLMFRVVILCWLLSPVARLRNCDGSVWSTDEMMTGRGKPMHLEGNLPNDTSTTNTTKTVLWLSMDIYSGKLVSNCLIYNICLLHLTQYKNDENDIIRSFAICTFYVKLLGWLN